MLDSTRMLGRYRKLSPSPLCPIDARTLLSCIEKVGLPLLSLDGMTVKRIQQWILRCSACFKTCKELSRLFCPICGSAAMSRVACSVDARAGNLRLHMRKKRKNNLRGTKYSIPAPNPTKGRFEGDLLLREDQLLTGIWAQKVRRTVESQALKASPWL